MAIADSVAMVGLGKDAMTIDEANANCIFKIDDGNAETAILFGLPIWLWLIVRIPIIEKMQRN